MHGCAPDTVDPVLPPSESVITLTGAGDIANCVALAPAVATGRLLDGIPGWVFTAGDNVYPVGAEAEWQECFRPSWGRHRARTFPTIGNHDIATNAGRAYMEYWGEPYANGGRAYYSLDLGTWHLVMLNSEIDVTRSSTQLAWLRADLAEAPKGACILAVWHRPRFSSSAAIPGDVRMQELWSVLYEFKADIVVNGHSHSYERFARQDPSGRADALGIRQFVVGTGGAQLFPLGEIAANSEAHDDETFGVLQLKLGVGKYDWRFIPVPGGKQFTDAGTSTCIQRQ